MSECYLHMKEYREATTTVSETKLISCFCNSSKENSFEKHCRLFLSLSNCLSYWTSHLRLQRGNNFYQVPIFQLLLVTCQKHPIRPFPIAFLVFIFLSSLSIFPKPSLLFQWPKYFHFFIKISNHWSSTLYCYSVSSGYLYCFSYSVHIGMVTTFCQKRVFVWPILFSSSGQNETKLPELLFRSYH